MTINKRIIISSIVPVIQHGRQGLCRLNLTGMQTCQALVKENLETNEKNLEIAKKSSDILFFPRSNPFSIKGTRHQPNSQGLLPLLKWRTDTEKTDDELLNTSKNRSSVQKSSKYSVFSLLVYPFMALALLKNIHLLFKNLFSERFFPKNREIGSLVVRP